MRCDGLVVATPAGSTGYNLANGGPVMAWGVEGFVVSFIAPHSMTARALVAAPDDRLTIHNRSREPLDIAVDGRPAGEIEAGRRRSRRASTTTCGTIAQLPGSSSTAACARSSAGWRADGRRGQAERAAPRRMRAAAPSGVSVVLHRGDEPSSCSREKRRWPPGVR